MRRPGRSTSLNVSLDKSGHRFDLGEQFGQQALAIVVATFLDAELDNACDHGTDLRDDIDNGVTHPPVRSRR